jgi:hypothetical protein
MKLRKTERERTPLACDFRRPAENLVPHILLSVRVGYLVVEQQRNEATKLKSRKQTF